LDTNATQLTGLAAFAAACAACAWAARRGDASLRGSWLMLALLHALLFVDVLLGLRHQLHDAVAGLLGNRYASRHLAQWVLLALAALLAWWVARRLLRARSVFASGRLTPFGLAALATALVAALFAVEAISWHEIDRLLYLRVGPWLLIALGWAAGAVGTIVGALRSPTR
jgi:hypothetical protein